MKAIARYLLTHWQGKQGLFWSFWVNLVALRAALFALQEYLVPAEDTDWSAYGWQFMAWAVFAHGVVLVWQFVGVLRAAEYHQQETGSIASSWGAQLALVPLFFLACIYLLGAWQQIQPVPNNEHFSVTMEKERSGLYKMNIIPSFLAIDFNGSIELGVTKKLKGILESGVPIRLVILESNGGNIYEARGMAKLIESRELQTHVDGNCSSACTSVFMAGKKRTMSDKAKIGFHQYRVDANFSIIAADPQQEQARDLAFFKRRGLSDAFLAKVFDQPSSAMWFPEAAELLEAGVVHEVISSN